MREQYGTREQAKREIFARYASFIYLGSGRYGFAAASEYYFDKPLADYTSRGRRPGGAAGGHRQVAARLRARCAGNPRPLQRRNQILALMARNGSIPEDARPALPGRADRRPAPGGGEDRGARGDRPRAGRAAGARRRALHGGGPVPGQDPGALDGRPAGAEDRQRGPGERPRRLREAAPRRAGAHPGLGGGAGQRGTPRSWPRRAGGRSTTAAPIRYSDFNRVTDSLRQPGSVMKPLVYLAAFRNGLTLDATVPDAPISVPLGSRDPRSSGSPTTTTGSRARSPRARRWPSPATRSRCGSPGPSACEKVIRTCRELGFRTPLHPYISTALGASEVRLLELAGAYRAMASGVRAEPHVIARVTDGAARLLFEAPGATGEIPPEGLALVQEGLRGVVRLPGGTAHALSGREFPIPGDGQDGHDERVPGRSLRRIHLRAAGHHGRGPDRLRRRSHAGPRRRRAAARRCRSFARSCCASTRRPWSGRPRRSRARWRTGSTRTWPRRRVRDGDARRRQRTAARPSRAPVGELSVLPGLSAGAGPGRRQAITSS